MKRYCLSAKTFTGEAELIYDDAGALLKIDFSNTSTTVEQRYHIKINVPMTLTHLEEGGHNLSKSISIIAKDIEISFEMFWKEYPYKRNRHLVEGYWPMMNKTDQVTAYLAAIEYGKYCTRNKWYNAKIADLWLKKKEFLNDWKNL